MLPEDYEPMPDDGYGRGDYPALPLDPWEMKDPWEDYDFPRERRFYGEPVRFLEFVIVPIFLRLCGTTCGVKISHVSQFSVMDTCSV